MHIPLMNTSTLVSKEIKFLETYSCEAVVGTDFLSLCFSHKGINGQERIFDLIHPQVYNLLPELIPETESSMATMYGTTDRSLTVSNFLKIIIGMENCQSKDVEDLIIKNRCFFSPRQVCMLIKRHPIPKIPKNKKNQGIFDESILPHYFPVRGKNGRIFFLCLARNDQSTFDVFIDSFDDSQPHVLIENTRVYINNWTPTVALLEASR
ncbi:MAG TPA: hypothetical protein VMR73_00050 [Candidatus Paceibacterota bacterium]|nr:hypothetical protein [Candidatus Paceibacterota bacterium]